MSVSGALILDLRHVCQ